MTKPHYLDDMIDKRYRDIRRLRLEIADLEGEKEELESRNRCKG